MTTKRFLALAVFTLCAHDRINAQGIQALRGLGEQAKQQATDSAAILVRCRLEQYATTAARMRSTEARPAVARASVAGEALMLMRGEPDRFKDRLPAFIAADHEARANLKEPLATDGLDGKCGSRTRDGYSIEASLPDPAIYTLVPQVAFTAAYGGSVRAGRYVAGLGFNTNLAGAAIGSAFDALGSGALKEYFTNNVAIGAAVPTSGARKISSDLGLGLGGVRIGNWALWPVLGIEELDSADARLLPDLTARKPNQGNWSQLAFAIGVPIGRAETAIARMRCGKLAPVLSIGIGLPYYFPGSSYTAIASVFTSRRDEYEHAGSASLLIGLDVPLLKVGSEPTGDAKEKCAGL